MTKVNGQPADGYHPQTSTDTRIAYGAMCCWWDVIQKVATRKDSGLPCCPTCGGLLLEVPDMDTWMAAARTAEADNRPGYADFITWMQGRCFKTMAAAGHAYLQETGKSPNWLATL